MDIVCGSGVDTIVAVMMVDPKGMVTGIDLVPEMLAQASENARSRASGMWSPWRWKGTNRAWCRTRRRGYHEAFALAAL
jgi:trans-aconitate methyltransferase